MSVNLIDSSNIEVKQSGSDISLDLGSEVVVDSIRSKNMFDKNSVAVGGFLDDGSIVGTSTLFYTPNYIEVKPSTTYTFSSSSSSERLVICEYNSSKTFIKRNIVTNSSSYTITTSSTTTYVRLNSVLANLDNLQFEEGSSRTTYSAYQNLNPDTSGLDNGHFKESNGYGGFVKRTVRGNKTTYTFSVPNHQNSGFIRNALVMCGDKGFMVIRWNGNNGINPTVSWSSFTSSQVSLSHSNGILTITFNSTVYGSVDVLFTN